jgi:hypothetical protein
MVIRGDSTSEKITLDGLITKAKSEPVKIHVPVQRAYVWDGSLVAWLCGEFKEVIGDKNSKCFLNSLLLSNITKYLLDGQQRCTTNLILVRMLTYLYEKDMDAIPSGDGKKLKEWTREAQRHCICGIDDEETFFKLLSYEGGEEAALIAIKFKESLSNSEIKSLINKNTENRYSISNPYQRTAMIFYDFIKYIDETYENTFDWNNLISRIEFNYITLPIAKGDESMYFCVTNACSDPMDNFSLVKSLVGDENFFKLIKVKDNDQYDYFSGSNGNSPCDVFVSHILQVYLLKTNRSELLDYKKNILFSPAPKIVLLYCFLCVNEIIKYPEEKKKFIADYTAYSKFYYDVVCAGKIPEINLIADTGRLPSIVSSLFVIYQKYYNEDIEMFRNCMKHIYLITLLAKVEGSRSHPEAYTRRFAESVYNDKRPNFNTDLLSFNAYNINSIRGLCVAADGLIKKEQKVKGIFTYIEYSVRKTIGLSRRIDDNFTNADERKYCELDHFVPIGADRFTNDIRNTLGNFFIVDKSNNASKNDARDIDIIRDAYTRCPYISTKMFVDINNMLVGEREAFNNLLHEIDKSELFEGSMYDSFYNLQINEESMTDEYIKVRGEFVKNIFSYAAYKELSSLKNYFTDKLLIAESEDDDISFAESPINEDCDID